MTPSIKRRINISIKNEGFLSGIIKVNADMKEYFVLFVVSCPPDIIVLSAGFDETAANNPVMSGRVQGVTVHFLSCPVLPN